MVVKIIDDCPTLKVVIYDGEPSAESLDQIKAKEGVRVMSLKELEDLGRSKGKVKVVAPKRNDVCCVMYTSVSPSSFALTLLGLLTCSFYPGIHRNTQGSDPLARKPHRVSRCRLDSSSRGSRPLGPLPRLPPSRTHPRDCR